MSGGWVAVGVILGVLLAGVLVLINEFVLDNGWRRLMRVRAAQDRAFTDLARGEEDR